MICSVYRLPRPCLCLRARRLPEDADSRCISVRAEGQEPWQLKLGHYGTLAGVTTVLARGRPLLASSAPMLVEQAPARARMKEGVLASRPTRVVPSMFLAPANIAVGCVVARHAPVLAPCPHGVAISMLEGS